MKKCVSISLDGTAKDSSGTTKVKSATAEDSSSAKCVKVVKKVQQCVKVVKKVQRQVEM